MIKNVTLKAIIVLISLQAGFAGKTNAMLPTNTRFPSVFSGSSTPAPTPASTRKFEPRKNRKNHKNNKNNNLSETKFPTVKSPTSSAQKAKEATTSIRSETKEVEPAPIMLYSRIRIIKLIRDQSVDPGTKTYYLSLLIQTEPLGSAQRTRLEDLMNTLTSLKI
jgi:hypothetical protein